MLLLEWKSEEYWRWMPITHKTRVIHLQGEGKVSCSKQDGRSLRCYRERIRRPNSSSLCHRAWVLSHWNETSSHSPSCLKLGVWVSRGFLSDCQSSDNSGLLSPSFSSSHTVHSILQSPPLTIFFTICWPIMLALFCFFHICVQLSVASKLTEFIRN